ncbi:MAG: hypothetical protein HQM08_21905 [Candidatus Riflebacteria bacterium]|nr:hypothetical protein [Candidatus Riflebacteria bacterium]
MIFYLLISVISSAQGNTHDDILPIKDIKTGMKGIGKTVIQGKEIETFNVEVMGTLVNNKINDNVLITGKSILVRVSGKVISDAGGIAAGMSGSPIYINGKIIGGLSSGWVMTDHTVGLVTPIEEMLEIWDYPLQTCLPENYIKWNCENPIELAGKRIESIWEVGDPDSISQLPVSGSDLVFARAAAPAVIQGLWGKAADLLTSKFKKRGIQVVADPMDSKRGDSPLPLSPTSEVASGSAQATDTVEPGMAVGVQLARGDINLTTLGTLTYRDGKKVLAFAHSFLKKGNVAYLMTQAHIYHCFSSVQMPFKIGAPTENLGIITQDREKGIAGEIGRFPAMIPIQLDMTDKDLKRTRSINFQVVKDPGVLSTVLESTLLQAIEGVIDRSGEGTALLSISLDAANSKGAKYNLHKENLFYSKADIVNSLINEVNNLVESIIENEIEEVTPSKISLKVEVENKRKTMTIEKVEVKNSSVTPGGNLEIWVTLRPYREKSLVQKAKLPIPSNIGKENLRLTVFGISSRNQDNDGEPGGGGEQVPPKQTTKPVKELKLDEPPRENFDQIVQEWSESPKNSDLLFQLSAEDDPEKKIKFSGKDHHVIPTTWVIQGSVDTVISLSED